MATTVDAYLGQIADGDALTVVVALLDRLDSREVDELQRLHLPRVRLEATNDPRRVPPVLLPMRAHSNGMG